MKALPLALRVNIGQDSFHPDVSFVPKVMHILVLYPADQQGTY